MADRRRPSLVISAVWLSAIGAAAPCLHVHERVVPVGRAAEPETPPTFTVTTDRDHYRSGESMHVTMRVTSARPTRWWARFPLTPAFEACNSNILIRLAGEPHGPVVYDRSVDAVAQSCRLFDGGPGASHGTVRVPPPFEITARIRLVANTGDETGRSLAPGLYAVEALLYLGPLPSGGADTPPDITPLRATRSIRVTD